MKDVFKLERGGATMIGGGVELPWGIFSIQN